MTLTAVNNKGVVTITRSVAAAPSDSTVTPDASAACSETGYAYEGPKWNVPDKWYYNEASVSRSGLSVSLSLTSIRDGNKNMSTGVNDCGYDSHNGFNVTGPFQGNTSRYANVDSAGNCTSSFPDGRNTDSWGPYNSGLTTLATTCWHYSVSPNVMSETDIYFGSNVGLVDNLPSGCTSKYDLMGVATHEWGHAFGLAHETSGQYETMYPTLQPCNLYWRTLGNGDWHGMDNAYGFR